MVRFNPYFGRGLEKKDKQLREGKGEVEITEKRRDREWEERDGEKGGEAGDKGRGWKQGGKSSTLRSL